MSTPQESIRRLIGIYFGLVDDKDVEGILGLFPEDGLLDVRGNVCNGHDEMRTFLTTLFGAAPSGIPGIHIVSNGQLIDVKGSEATATTDVMVMRYIDKAWTPALINTHRDKVALHGDRWVFTEKRVVALV